MTLPHAKGYASAEDARHSKKFLSNPDDAKIVEDCRFCDRVHVELPARNSAPVRRVLRDTGPSRQVRQVVLGREGWRCAACGVSVIGLPHSVQHRVARGAGGTSDPAANAFFNLVLLCGTANSPGGCHLLCEQRDPGMHGRGFWLRSWENPALVPVMLASEHGSGITAWLSPDGTYSFEEPGAAA